MRFLFGFYAVGEVDRLAVCGRLAHHRTGPDMGVRRGRPAKNILRRRPQTTNGGGGGGAC